MWIFKTLPENHNLTVSYLLNVCTQNWLNVIYPRQLVSRALIIYTDVSCKQFKDNKSSSFIFK